MYQVFALRISGFWHKQKEPTSLDHFITGCSRARQKRCNHAGDLIETGHFWFQSRTGHGWRQWDRWGKRELSQNCPFSDQCRKHYALNFWSQEVNCYQQSEKPSSVRLWISSLSGARDSRLQLRDSTRLEKHWRYKMNLLTLVTKNSVMCTYINVTLEFFVSVNSWRRNTGESWGERTYPTLWLNPILQIEKEEIWSKYSF